MASVEPELLEAYKSDLATQQAGALSWMRHYAFPGETRVTDWYGLTPLVLVWALGADIVNTCSNDAYYVDEEYYNIRMACIIQAYDMSYGTESPNVPDQIEITEKRRDLTLIYAHEDFGITGNCNLVNWRYGVPTVPGFEVNNEIWAHAVEIDLRHTWINQTSV